MTAYPQLAAARAALANPELTEEYRRLKAAERALTAATTERKEAEAAWLTLVRPAVDERRAMSGRCQADRDGECTWCGCPQLRDGEPGATGRSCPLPSWDED